MPCDGKNQNCERRRELLTQLKCLVSSMERKKPCEWDEPSSPPLVTCPTSPCNNSFPNPVNQCRSFDLRAGFIYRCECIKRNGLQDRCMMWDCMGRPECMTKLYPVCNPGRSALIKLTELGDVEFALKKFYCADQAREAALAAYCRLICSNTQNNNNQYCCTNEVEYPTVTPCSNTSPNEFNNAPVNCTSACMPPLPSLPCTNCCTPPSCVSYDLCTPCPPPSLPISPVSCTSPCPLPCPSQCPPIGLFPC